MWELKIYDVFYNRNYAFGLKNACDLLNRGELSRTQNRELQRYIDENQHLIQFAHEQTTGKSIILYFFEQNLNFFTRYIRETLS
ncbi:unnamed protein product [Enterobius vermicularis]|uniref:LisH domain-containing protein n=1 Tax=Enterobius vermicularis TaxID=51028 RepID=A0A0N4V0Y3_ENTVE|nr:unnamed protein product [Enterobius vermicularis]